MMNRVRIWAISVGLAALGGWIFWKTPVESLSTSLVVNSSKSQPALPSAVLSPAHRLLSQAPPSSNPVVSRAPAATVPEDETVGSLDFKPRSVALPSHRVLQKGFESRYRWSAEGLKSVGLPQWKTLSARSENLGDEDRIFNYPVAELTRSRTSVENFHGPIAVYDPDQKRVAVVTGKITVRFKEESAHDPD
ncbi:MAG: hypothetical protein EOP09_16395, partial [Proteobacteria bacterium]